MYGKRPYTGSRSLYSTNHSDSVNSVNYGHPQSNIYLTTPSSGYVTSSCNCPNLCNTNLKKIQL